MSGQAVEAVRRIRVRVDQPHGVIEHLRDGHVLLARCGKLRPVLGHGSVHVQGAIVHEHGRQRGHHALGPGEHDGQGLVGPRRLRRIIRRRTPLLRTAVQTNQRLPVAVHAERHAAARLPQMLLEDLPDHPPCGAGQMGFGDQFLCTSGGHSVTIPSPSRYSVGTCFNSDLV